MKSGIIGRPGSGKTTVFEALTGNFQETGRRGDDRIAAIRVPDPRVDVLAGMYTPQKTTYAPERASRGTVEKRGLHGPR